MACRIGNAVHGVLRPGRLTRYGPTGAKRSSDSRLILQWSAKLPKATFCKLIQTRTGSPSSRPKALTFTLSSESDPVNCESGI